MVRTVPRSSVAKWPDSGATSSTARLLGVDVLLEMQQRAERRDMRGLLAHLDLAVAGGDVRDAERRAVVGEAGARDQLVGRREIAHRAVAGHADAGMAERTGRHARKRPDRAHHVGMGLIGRVQHSQVPCGVAAARLGGNRSLAVQKD